MDTLPLICSDLLASFLTLQCRARLLFGIGPSYVGLALNSLRALEEAECQVKFAAMARYEIENRDEFE